MWQFLGGIVREIFSPENLNQLKDVAMDHAELNVEAAKEIAKKTKEALTKKKF